MIHLIGILDHVHQCSTDFWPPEGEIRVIEKYKKYQQLFYIWLEKELNKIKNLAYIFEEWTYDKDFPSIASKLAEKKRIYYIQVDPRERPFNNKTENNIWRESIWIKIIKKRFSSPNPNNAILMIGDDHIDSIISKLKEDYNIGSVIRKSDLKKQMDNLNTKQTGPNIVV